MSYALKNLEGVKKKVVQAEWLPNSKALDNLLNITGAVTTAGNNGAINIWRDDNGIIHCEAMQFCRRLEKKEFELIAPAISWAATWMKFIKAPIN